MRIRLLVATIVGTAFLSSFSLNAAPQVAPPPAAPPPVAPLAEEALGGLDPVRLVQGQQVDGQDALTVVWRGLVYYFSTPQTKAAFEAEPARYSVQLDGLCARMGPPVLGAQSLFAVHDGHIYVFGSEDCRKHFTATPASYLDTAPSAVATATPEQLRLGRVLLDRAVAAHGGAALATLHAFRERTQQDITGTQGAATVAIETTAILPDRWRQDLSNQYGRFLLVITPGSAFRSSSRMTPRPLSDALRTYYLGAFGAHPLALLRAHRTSPLRAAALDQIDENGAKYDRVAVQHDGAVVVLTLDPAGRIVRQTTRGRAPRTGVIASLARTLSDFRTVGAFTVPYRVDATVDGVASPDLSYAITSIDIDPAVDDAAIVRPLESKP